MTRPPANPPGPMQRVLAVILAVVPLALFLCWFWPFLVGPLCSMQFMWILCGVLFALDLVFFIAAWRRGFRWFFSRRALRFYAWVVVGFISFVVLYYAEESWRGKRAWAALQREAASRGESLEFKLPIPPATPDEENFVKAPGMEALLYSTESHWDGGVFYHGHEHDWPGGYYQVSWTLQQFTDLDAWQKYFLRILPSPTEPRSPTNLLPTLSLFESNLATLRAASRRPAMTFPLDYSKGFFAVQDLNRPLRPLRSAAHLLALRASAELAQGQAEAAGQDVLLALRLVELLRAQPFGVTKAISRGMVEKCFQPLWEGLATHRWSEAQLAAFQQQLAGLDLVADYREEARSEMIMMEGLFDEGLAFVTGRPSEFARQISPSDPGERFAGWLAKTFYPVGWLYLDKVWVYRFFERRSDPFVVAGLGEKPPREFIYEMISITDPVMMTFVVPRLKQITAGAGDAVFIQVFLHEAVTACALERYRLAHSQYPDTLEALAPGYLQQIPADILARPPAPLKYHRTDGGGFRLYSVGTDRTDDGGKARRLTDPHYVSLAELDEGGCDLVWVQPAAATANSQ